MLRSTPRSVSEETLRELQAMARRSMFRFEDFLITYQWWDLTLEELSMVMDTAAAANLSPTYLLFMATRGA